MIVVFNVIVAVLAVIGAVTIFMAIRLNWRMGTRGEYRCSECGHRSPLPLDGERDGVTFKTFCEWMARAGVFVAPENGRQATVDNAFAKIVRIDIVLENGETVKMTVTDKHGRG